MPFIEKFNLGNKAIRTLRVRAIIALILVCGATVGFFKGIVPYDSYMQLVMMCVGWWMGNASSTDFNNNQPKPSS